MEKKQDLKNDIWVCLLIGLTFLLVGAEYITWWLYRLVPNTTESAADILSEGVGYLFQVLGLIAFAFLIKKRKNLISAIWSFPLLLLLTLLLCAVGFFSDNFAVILISGFAMNFFIGLISGYYLTKLALYATKKRTGIVFGVGYAIGTVITYLLSSVFEGCLGSPYVFIIYLVIGLLALASDYFLKCQTNRVSGSRNISTFAEDSYTGQQIILAAFVVFLFSFVKNIGFYFPTASYVSGAVDPVLVRCTYAIGLIAAGIINDKSRRYGSICCLCALVFPFLVLALDSITIIDIIVWILGYLFFGFFSVYRVVVFSDIARSNTDAIYLAGFGLLFGRIGDATGSMTGVFIGDRAGLLILITTLLFIVNIFIYFKFYNQVYVTVIPKVQSQADVFADFLKYYDISLREKDVLRQVLDGLSNSEIAAKLFISESTVKFHIHNILKKTKTANRSQLIETYQQFGNTKK